MSISIHESLSISQLSQTEHKTFANKGLDDKISFKSINDFFLFPFYDELLQTIKLNSIFTFFLAICLIIQSMNVFLNFTDNYFFDFLNDYGFSKYYESFTIPIFYFLMEILFFCYLIIQYRYKRTFNYRQLYFSAVILCFFNVIFYMPTCGVCGHSVIKINQCFEKIDNNRNLENKNSITSENKKIQFFPLFSWYFKNKSHYSKNYYSQNNYIKNNKKLIKDESIIIDIIMNNDDEEQSIYEFGFIKYTFSLIFSLIQIVIFTIQITYHFHFESESPFINRTIFSMWDCKVFISFIFLNGFCRFISTVFDILPNWFKIFYHILMLFIDVYIMYYTFFQPFIKICMNSFFQSLLSYNFITNIIILLWKFKQWNILIAISNLSFLFFILFFVIFYLINKKIINNINAKLTPPEIPDDEQDEDEDDNENINNERNLLKLSKKKKRYYQLTDREKREKFDNFVFQSIDHALLYFRVGILCSSPFFIDLSFVKFMKDTYNQDEIQIFILKLVSIFPSNLQLFSTWLSVFSKKEDFLSVYQQCVMYQLHRINNSRQSNSSKEIQKELMILDDLTDETISAIRSFWIEILHSRDKINISSLAFISKLTQKTKSYYIDLIEKYPNSIQVLNSFCRFLVESCGDYIECAKIGQRIRFIELGRYINDDLCFRAFVNVFPQYLKRRIIDDKGSFIVSNNGSFSSQLSSSISSSQNSSSNDIFNIRQANHFSLNNKNKNEDLQMLFEQENFESLINSLYYNGKAKLSIQQIVNQSKSIALISSLVIAILQFIFFFCIMCLEFGFIAQYKTPIEHISSSARTSRIIFSLQYCSLIAGVQSLSKNFNVNISSQIVKFMNIKEENLPNFPCTFINPMISLRQMSSAIANNIYDEMKYLISNSKDHVNELNMYNALNTSISFDSQDFDNDNNPDIDDSLWENGVFIYKFKDRNYSIYKTSLRNSLEYFRALTNRLAYNITSHFDNDGVTDDKRNLSDINDMYFELLINGLTISEPFFHLFNIISENGIDIISNNERNIKTINAAVLIVVMVFFMILRINCFFKIKQFWNSLLEIICSIKSEDINETMKPIFIKTKRSIKIHFGNNHSTYESSSSTLIFYLIVTIFSIINVLGIFSISIFQVNSSFSFIRNAQQWENDGASRFLYLIKMINCVIAEHLDIPNFKISDKLKFSSKELLSLSQKLDLSIIGKGKKLNQYYFMIDDNTKINSQKSSNLENTSSTINRKCTELNNSDILTRMNLATFLDCVSIENKINLGILYYQLMEISLKDYALVESPDFIASLFILDKYLYRDLPGFQDKISETTISEVNKKKRNIYLIGVFGMIMYFIYFFFEYIVVKKIFYSFIAFKQLILVLPISTFVNNQTLVNFLINSLSYFGSFKFCQNVNINGDNLSEFDILLNSVDEGVIIVDKNFIIQLVNPGVQKMTGFTADQLLGQNIQYLIPLTSKQDELNLSLEKHPFYQRINEIMNSNENRSTALNTKVLTDKGNEILVHAILIGIFDDKNQLSKKNNNTPDINDEGLEVKKEFICTSIIMKDISAEMKIKKKLKETKRQNEALLNFLLPQPVLENIREKKKPGFYFSDQAIIIKIKLCGLDEYIGTIGPKTMMANLKNIFTTIDQISQKNSVFDHILFKKEEENKKLNNTENTFAFKTLLNLDLNSIDEEYEDTKIISKTARCYIKDKEGEEEEAEDKNIDFDCIYNIRNDNDQIISISGLFDNKNELKKQADSCIHYAFKVKKIIKKMELDEHINFFIHTKIAICLGGPITAIVENPVVPQLQIFSCLFTETENILNYCNLDSICINENLYNVIKDDYDVEEQFVQKINPSNKESDSASFEKIFVVNERLNEKTKKKNDDVNNFTISSDSEN